jgi:hypothetical protein
LLRDAGDPERDLCSDADRDLDSEWDLDLDIDCDLDLDPDRGLDPDLNPANDPDRDLDPAGDMDRDLDLSGDPDCDEALDEALDVGTSGSSVLGPCCGEVPWASVISVSCGGDSRSLAIDSSMTSGDAAAKNY